MFSDNYVSNNFTRMKQVNFTSSFWINETLNIVTHEWKGGASTFILLKVLSG